MPCTGVSEAHVRLELSLMLSSLIPGMSNLTIVGWRVAQSCGKMNGNGESYEPWKAPRGNGSGRKIAQT